MHRVTVVLIGLSLALTPVASAQTTSLETRPPTKQWDEVAASLKIKWRALNSRGSFGPAGARSNLPHEREIIAEMEELVMLSIATPAPATLADAPPYARYWGLVKQAHRDSTLSLAASDSDRGKDGERLDKVKAALDEAATRMRLALTTAYSRDEGLLVERIGSAIDASTLDAAFRSELGLPMRSVCGWEPFVDRSLTGPDPFPRSAEIYPQVYDLLPPTLSASAGSKCLELDIRRTWSAKELARKNPVMSTGEVKGYRFDVPAKYDPPTADEIRRTMMREAVDNSAAIAVDDDTLLLSGENELTSDIRNKLNALMPMAGMSIRSAGVNAPGMLQTVLGIERGTCTAASEGGYRCKFLVDVELVPNAAAASVDFGPLSAMAERMNALGPVEVSYRFELTSRGWRSPDMAALIRETGRRSMQSMYSAIGGAAGGAARTICALGQGGNDAWVSSAAGCR